MDIRPRHTKLLSTAAVALITLSATLTATTPAAAAAGRTRLGSTADVTRASWQGPAFTMNGDGKINASSMAAAVDAIRGGTGSLDVVVLAGSAPTSGSPTPECDAALVLPGVNSCTSWTLTAASDGNNSQVNADIRNAEFVYFAGGDQCRYAAWKGTALEASVESVVAKGGGSGGGSAGHHINSPLVYDACKGGVTSAEALANPYDSYITFTTGMFSWPNYAGVINDSHFTTRDRMGRTMAFVARTIKDGLTSGGKAWGVGVEEGSSLLLDKNGLATLYGKEAFVIQGDHQPEQTTSGKPLTFSNYKIWRLGPGQTYDFKNRPTCGYYLRSVTAGVIDSDPYTGTPQTSCGTTGTPATLPETEPNDTRSAANGATAPAYPANLTGTMKSTTDRDYFRIALSAGDKLSVGCAIPDAYDADLYLVDADGSTISRSVNDGTGADESLAFTRTAAGSGTYYLELDAYQGSGNSLYTCALTKS
ncbi:pre-peptidase C-terminal domain-containing protein [Streptomyces sp. NPDC051577]|uniref:pre-peptidase C-terminal domain-containing protein n=1 Tax=Streptomyces sp. NPDC051577 TaxID=3155166 RepID=UPI003429BA31